MYERFQNIGKYVFLFLLGALLILVITVALMGLNKEWFEKKIYYYTELSKTEGLHEGSEIQMGGLRIGQITEVVLNKYDKFTFKLQIKDSYKDRIKKDSIIRIYSPTIIGSKICELSIGSPNEAKLPPNSYIPARVEMDIIALISGANLDERITKLEATAERVLSLLDRVINTLNNVDVAIMKADHAFQILGQASEKLDVVAAKVGSNNTSIGKIVNDKGKIFDDVMGMLDTVKKILGNVDNAEQLTEGKIKDLADKADKLISGLQDISNQVGGATPELIDLLKKDLKEAQIVLKAIEKHWLLKKYAKKAEEEQQNEASKQEPIKQEPTPVPEKPIEEPMQPQPPAEEPIIDNQQSTQSPQSFLDEPLTTDETASK